MNRCPTCAGVLPRNPSIRTQCVWCGWQAEDSAQPRYVGKLVYRTDKGEERAWFSEPMDEMRDALMAADSEGLKVLSFNGSIVCKTVVPCGGEQHVVDERAVTDLLEQNQN